MREKLSNTVLIMLALLALPGSAWSQAAPRNSTLVDIEALARLTDSSLSFKGNQVILNPPGAAASTPPPPAASQPASPEFSEELRTSFGRHGFQWSISG